MVIKWLQRNEGQLRGSWFYSMSPHTLGLGFDHTGLKPRWVLCRHVLASKATNSQKLLQHLHIKHEEINSKSKELFGRNTTKFKGQ